MLAIVIPYYKISFFEATLESLANQTNKNFKVYIGNDASLESPEILLEKFSNRIDFIYEKFSNNIGGTSLIKQWERCINLAGNEEWVLILGDDDYLSSNVVEEFYKIRNELEFSDIDVVRLSLIKIDDKNNVLADAYIHPKLEKSTDFIMRRRKTSLSEYIFKKEKVLNIGFRNFPSALFSDIVAVLEFSNYSTVLTVNNANVFVRISNDNVSGHSINMKEHFKAEKMYYFHLLENLNFFNKIQTRFIYDRINNQIVKNFKSDFVFLFRILFHYLRFSFKDFYKLIYEYCKVILKKKLK